MALDGGDRHRAAESAESHLAVSARLRDVGRFKQREENSQERRTAAAAVSETADHDVAAHQRDRLGRWTGIPSLSRARQTLSHPGSDLSGISGNHDDDARQGLLPRSDLSHAVRRWWSVLAGI